jgi:hypothetical protein
MIQPHLSNGDIGKASQMANLIAPHIGVMLFSIFALVGVKPNTFIRRV